MPSFGRGVLTLVGYSPVNKLLSALMLKERTEWEGEGAKWQEQLKPVKLVLARVHDVFLWRIVGLVSYVFAGASFRWLAGIFIARRLADALKRLVPLR